MIHKDPTALVAALARTALEHGPADPTTVRVTLNEGGRLPDLTVNFAPTGEQAADRHAADLVRGEIRIHDHSRPGNGLTDRRLAVRALQGAR
ncbi:hypothetical protein AB0O64_23180 [Streptomyces sp. NPDC088341]|uniref:hypothetical protein n=1 Tax=Streptomyces sp. NPDC088341 TaxID=3154870 RepID=UPI0034439CC1